MGKRSSDYRKAKRAVQQGEAVSKQLSEDPEVVAITSENAGREEEVTVYRAVERGIRWGVDVECMLFRKGWQVGYAFGGGWRYLFHSPGGSGRVILIGH